MEERSGETEAAMFVCVCAVETARGTRVCAWLGLGGRGRGSEVKDGCGRPDAVFRSTIVRRPCGSCGLAFVAFIEGFGRAGVC